MHDNDNFGKKIQLLKWEIYKKDRNLICSMNTQYYMYMENLFSEAKTRTTRSFFKEFDVVITKLKVDKILTNSRVCSNWKERIR